MVNAVSNAQPSQPVAKSAAASPKKPVESAPKSAPQSAPAEDSVQLSSAGQAMLAALQEARETPAQTAQEANGGDRQAQRLQAQEAAAKPSAK